MKRPQGDVDTAQEAESFDDELRVQLVLFSQWLEAQGFTKEVEPGVELTHSDLANAFMEGVAT